MTLSDRDRLAAVELALRAMLDDLGERPFPVVMFEIGRESDQTMPQTTWEELRGLGYVEAADAIGNPAFRLTGRGWIAALKASDSWASDALQDRMVRLRAALKDVVKGRPLQGAATSVPHLHRATGLSEAWITNALASRLIQVHWPWDHLDVDLERGLPYIRVPARFGSKRLMYEAGPFPDP